jgi:NTE family protein
MDKNIGICLCGGGARGIAHIGVLQALEENGISPQFISGASMGAIVGAFYAAGKTPYEILKIVSKTKLYKLFTFGIPLNGLIELDYLKNIIENNLPYTTFETLQKKLFVAISNLTTGQCEIIEAGSLFDIVIASASIPLIFKPIKIGNYMYVDGGLLNNLPVEPLIRVCDDIIGVNVNPNIISEDTHWNMLSIGERCFDLIMWANVAENLKKCSVVIETRKTVSHRLFDFKSAKEIAQYGYDATKLMMPEIKEKLCIK